MLVSLDERSVARIIDAKVCPSSAKNTLVGMQPLRARGEGEGRAGAASTADKTDRRQGVGCS